MGEARSGCGGENGLRCRGVGCGCCRSCGGGIRLNGNRRGSSRRGRGGGGGVFRDRLDGRGGQERSAAWGGRGTSVGRRPHLDRAVGRGADVLWRGGFRGQRFPGHGGCRSRSQGGGVFQKLDQSDGEGGEDEDRRGGGQEGRLQKERMPTRGAFDFDDAGFP